MNASLKNFFTFIAAVVVGMVLMYVMVVHSANVSPSAAAAAAFGAGYSFFLFGWPLENPHLRQMGCGFLGLAAGIIWPDALCFALMGARWY